MSWFKNNSFKQFKQEQQLQNTKFQSEIADITTKLDQILQQLGSGSIGAVSDAQSALSDAKNHLLQAAEQSVAEHHERLKQVQLLHEEKEKAISQLYAEKNKEMAEFLAMKLAHEQAQLKNKEIEQMVAKQEAQETSQIIGKDSFLNLSRGEQNNDSTPAKPETPLPSKLKTDTPYFVNIHM